MQVFVVSSVFVNKYLFVSHSKQATGLEEHLMQGDTQVSILPVPSVFGSEIK